MRSRWKESIRAALRINWGNGTAEIALEALIRYEWGENGEAELRKALQAFQQESQELDPDLRPGGAADIGILLETSRNEEQQQLRVRMRSLLQTAVRELTPQGFDEALARFSEIRNQLRTERYADPYWRLLLQLADEGFDFLAAFQDARARLRSQEDAKYVFALRRLEGARPAVDAILPRSTYLDILRGYVEKAIEPRWFPRTDPELLPMLQFEAMSIHRADEFAPFLAKIQAQVEQGQSQIVSSGLLAEWTTLNRLQRDLRLRRVDMRFLKETSMSRYGTEPPVPGVREDLRSILFSKALPVFLGLPPLEDRDVRPPKILVPKLVADAVAAQNWDLLMSILDVIRHLRLEEIATPLDLVGLESFVSARLYEKAGQLEFAVAQNELALSTGCQLLPAGLVGDSLVDLKRRDPDAFARGEFMLLSTGPERRKWETNRLPSP